MTWSIWRATGGYAVWYGGRSRVQEGGCDLEEVKRKRSSRVEGYTAREIDTVVSMSF